MALNRWPLDRLLAWVGCAALLVMFVPLGVYITHTVSSSVERSLLERGRGLAEALARQIMEPVLLDDRVAINDALQRAAASDGVIYICLESPQGRVLAHSFDTAYPAGLPQLWAQQRGGALRFRIEDDSLLDVSALLMEGQLGALHVGVSRRSAIQTGNRTLWLMGAATAAVLAIILAAAHFAAMRVGRPLRQLEEAVSKYPQDTGELAKLRVSGTQEVATLAKGIRGMLRRLTRLEQDRQATLVRMIHTERLAALGEVAAGLAHEIHNPLDGMLECVRMLDEDPRKSDVAAKYYPMLAEGLQRIAKTMRGMLTFARSGQNINIGACRTASVFESLMLLVETNVRDGRVRVTWENPGPSHCLCDPQGLTQAGLNLVLNAVEAAEGSESPRVSVAADCDSQWVYISVMDSGPGVAPELRGRVFDAFFTTKSADKGTGLGLSVSRELIRAIGGDVELSPAPNSLGGATFVIKVPRLTSPEGEQDGRACEDSDC